MARPFGGLVIHPGDAAFGSRHLGNRRALEYLRAPHPRALGQGHRYVGRVALPIQRKGHRADHAVDVEVRIPRLHLTRRNLMNLNIENPRHSRLPQQLLVTLCRQRDRDRADLLHPRGHARLGLQPAIKIGGILCQPRHVCRPAQLPDQPRRMPGCARGQLAAFKQDHVGPASLCQMIGH